jgi:hypothetical protein
MELGSRCIVFSNGYCIDMYQEGPDIKSNWMRKMQGLGLL